MRVRRGSRPTNRCRRSGRRCGLRRELVRGHVGGRAQDLAFDGHRNLARFPLGQAEVDDVRLEGLESGEFGVERLEKANLNP